MRLPRACLRAHSNLRSLRRTYDSWPIGSRSPKASVVVPPVIEVTQCYYRYIINVKQSDGNYILCKTLHILNSILYLHLLCHHYGVMLSVYKFRWFQANLKTFHAQLTVMVCFKSKSSSLSLHFIWGLYGLAPNTRHCSCSIWPSCVLPPPIIGKFGSDDVLTSRTDISSGGTVFKFTIFLLKYLLGKYT